MLRHGPGLHRREPQRADGDGIGNLPGSIGNPTATLPQSIAPTNVTPDPSATAPIVTAEAPSGLTTVTDTERLAQSITSLNTVSTITTEKVRTITDPLEYASLTSAAAISSSTSVQSTTSKASVSATASAAAAKSTPNISTLVPAIVVPVVVVLLASLGAFWFFMRRRHRRELESQPEFVMTGKGEKLSSRSNSGKSTSSDTAAVEKKPPAVAEDELPSSQTPPTAASEWPPAQIGVARPLTPQKTSPRPYNPPFSQTRPGPGPSQSRPYKNFNGPVPRPAASGRPVPPPASREPPQYRNRSDSIPGQRAPLPLRAVSREPPRAAPSPVSRSGPSPVPPRTSPIRSPQDNGDPNAAVRLRGPSPSMNHNARAQAPSRLAAPPPGAYNGASSISQYSPIVKDAPTKQGGSGPKRTPPPAINTSGHLHTDISKAPSTASPQGNVLTEENLRIARLANSSRLAPTPGEPSPSPKLPPPATRSQLIPRESLKENTDHLFGGSVINEPRSRNRDRGHEGPASPPTTFWASNRTSLVSEPDDYEDIEASSDVSSLNEFERFDFGPGVGSRSGSAAGASLNYFSSQNNPGGGGNSSPFEASSTHERW